jgi:hypothetical protein
MGHTVPPSELRDRVATHEHGERCIGVVRQKELYFSPPIWRIGHWEVKVWINSTPRSDKYVHIAQSYRFRA